MIRARLNNGLFVFGIDAENIRRMLKDKQPIYINLKDIGGSDRFALMAGETLDEVVKDMCSAGMEFPKPEKLDG